MNHVNRAPSARFVFACIAACAMAAPVQAEDVTEAAQAEAAVESATTETAHPSVIIVEKVPVHRPALEFVPDEIADQQITCTWEAPVGSRVLRKRCVTAEHRRIVSQAWQEWLLKVQHAFTYN